MIFLSLRKNYYIIFYELLHLNKSLITKDNLTKLERYTKPLNKSLHNTILIIQTYDDDTNSFNSK